MRIVRLCIVYETRRGSTERVAREMAHAAGDEADVALFRASQGPDIGDFDLVIVGSPIYYERPLGGVIEFICSNNGLKGKSVALFILCIADKFGRFGKAYSERRYMRLIEEHIRGGIIARKVFNGWIMKEDPETLEEARRWVKRVLKTYRDGGIIEGVEH